MKIGKLFFSVVILAATAHTYPMGGEEQDSPIFSWLGNLGSDSDLLLTDVYGDPQLDELKDLVPLPETMPAAALPFAQAPLAPALPQPPAALPRAQSFQSFRHPALLQASQPSALQRHRAAQSFEYQGPYAVSGSPLQEAPQAPALHTHPAAQPIISRFQYVAPRLPVQEAPQPSLQLHSVPQPMVPFYQGVAPRLPLQALTHVPALQPHSAAEPVMNNSASSAPSSEDIFNELPPLESFESTAPQLSNLVQPTFMPQLQNFNLAAHQDAASGVSLQNLTRSLKKRKLPQEKKIHICPNPGCNYQSSHLGHFKEHAQRHNPTEKVTCPECGSTFTTSSGLNRHMRTHTGAKPYKCDECGHTCSQAANMRRHIAQHTGNARFTCPTCPRKFIQKVHLQAHKCE